MEPPDVSRSARLVGPLSVDVDIAGTDDVEMAAWMAVAGELVQLAELPLLLTIRQEAEVLGICPAKAYQMAHNYEATGCDGLPVIRVGRSYRVPRWAFLVLALTGRVVTWFELAGHEQEVRRHVSGRRVTIPLGRGSGVTVRARSSGERAVGRVRRSPARRRVGSVEQLRLLPPG
jgi:hypothetical protein